ncbi:hypothetical protein BH10BDE1_BH10BDE1_18770 [soil metagenome]
MTKNSLILIGALILFASVAKAEDATIAVSSASLKTSGSMMSKSIMDLAGGTKVKKLGQKGDWAQIEVTDESGQTQTGFVRAGNLTTGTSVSSNLGLGKRVNTGAIKGALGAAGKGKSEASANAMDGMMDIAQNDESAAADDLLGADAAGLGDSSPAAPTASPKISNKALDHLDTIKIGDAEIMAFMKAGGLKSRILK